MIMPPQNRREKRQQESSSLNVISVGEENPSAEVKGID